MNNLAPVVENLPVTPNHRDDEMNPEQYEYPPGIMPSADAEYDHVKVDGVMTIYQKGELEDTHIKSDTFVLPLD